MEKKPSRLQSLLEKARILLDERGLRAGARDPRWHRFIHFWVLVWISFTRNRCPVRASALAYGSLLALIPMLAVVMSITSTFLKSEGEERIDQFIVKLVASVTPPAEVGTNTLTTPDAFAEETPGVGTNAPATNSPVGTPPAVTRTGGETATNAPALTEFAQDQKTVAARKSIARDIHEFIQNTRSGTLGLTGSVLLIFVAISMLSRIEDTFNDIWGVARGRSWFMRIVLYWGVLTLAPVLLVVALGLATGSHLETTKHLVATMPYVGHFLLELGFVLLPILVLSLTFGLLYMLMPNTSVHWQAALAGGSIAGVLFHLNNEVSVLYVSRVVSNSRIYGSLGLVPVFMIGLYLSWLILLFGAQVAYAFQNRASYAEEKQLENINQRGREFIALRLMTVVGQRFVQGEPPPSLVELGEALSVPTRLIRQLMQTLMAARLVVEASGNEPAYVPARPLETITCHDLLLALRATQGQELATRDEPTRAEVLSEYERIQAAERQAAASVTMLALVSRAQAQLHAGQPRALE
jgi:membrane protein